MTPKINPDFNRIKVVALGLLDGKQGCGVYSAAQIPTLRGWQLRHCIRLAVSTAIDQIREERHAPPRFLGDFGDRNFDRVVREIIRDRTGRST
jgi:hypothetical protein